MSAKSDEEKRVTFRMDPEKVDRLDDLIIQLKAQGELDRDVSRSEMIRGCVDDLIEELENRSEY